MGSSDRAGTSEQFVQRLLTNVRSYLVAQRAEDDRDAARYARLFGSDLAWLLGAHLRTEERWPQDAWIDDLIRKHVTITPTGELEVSGLIVWGRRETTVQWCEPFLALIAVRDVGNIAYSIRFALVSRGLGRSRYEMRDEIPSCDASDEWLFEFSRTE